jgi:hypothetical protein
MTTRRGYWFGVLLSACLCLGVVSGQEIKMVAEIPFEFHVGEAVLPPGTYSFGPKFQISNTVLEVAGEQQRIFKISFSERLENGESRSEVVFNKYEDGRHFLAEVRIPGQPARKMTRSRSEREMITTDWTVHQIALALHPPEIDSVD